MNLATRIRVARQHAGMSQEGLANSLGVSRGAVANWECSVTAPSYHRLDRLAQVTSIRLEWLVTGRGDMSYSLRDGPHTADSEVIYDGEEQALLSAFRVADRQLKDLVLRLINLQAHYPRKRRA